MQMTGDSRPQSGADISKSAAAHESAGFGTFLCDIPAVEVTQTASKEMVWVNLKKLSGREDVPV